MRSRRPFRLPLNPILLESPQLYHGFRFLSDVYEQALALATP